MTRGGLFFYSCFIDEIHLLDNRQNGKQGIQFNLNGSVVADVRQI